MPNVSRSVAESHAAECVRWKIENISAVYAAAPPVMEITRAAARRRTADLGDRLMKEAPGSRSSGQDDGSGALRLRLAREALEELRGDRRVDRQAHQGLPARGLAADVHARDVDPLLAEDRADRPDDALSVGVPEE